MDMGRFAWVLFSICALYVALAEEQGADPKKLTGTTQNDILKEYLSRGTYIFPPAPSLKLTADTIAWSLDAIPKWNAMNVCSYHLQEAGATPEQELAFALAAAIAVLDQVKARGEVAPERFAAVFSRISFFVNAGMRFVTELSKMRAFVQLWDEIGRERYGVDDEKARRFRYGVQVNSLGLTEAQQVLRANGLPGGAPPFHGQRSGPGQRVERVGHGEATVLRRQIELVVVDERLLQHVNPERLDGLLAQCLGHTGDIGSDVVHIGPVGQPRHVGAVVAAATTRNVRLGTERGAQPFDDTDQVGGRHGIDRRVRRNGRWQGHGLARVVRVARHLFSERPGQQGHHFSRAVGRNGNSPTARLGG